MKNQKTTIREAIERLVLKEAEKKEENKHRKCNKLINKIKGDVDTLAEMFEDMGIDQDSKPYKNLQKMYHILTGFDPVQTKMKEYFAMATETSANAMLQKEEDVKISSDADRESEQKAVDFSNKYDMDIEIKDDEEEGA